MYLLIRDRLPILQKIHKQACKAATIEDLSEIFPGLVALTDRHRTTHTATAAV